MPPEDAAGDAVGAPSRDSSAGSAAGSSGAASERSARSKLPRLLEAVVSVGSDLELRTALQHIVDSATELAAARYGALGIIDAERRTITELFTSGLTDTERERIGPLPDGRRGIIGALIQDPRPLRLDDLTADPRSSGVPEGHPEMHSFLGVPIRVHNEVLGNLYLAEKRGGPFTDDDLALLRVLGAQAGIAIGNARLYETARQRERWIEGAAAVTTALLTGEAAADALMTVAEQARVLADAVAGVVLQPTEGGGMEIVAASTRDDPGDLIGATIPAGSPVLVQLLGGEPVFVEDSASDPRMTTPVRHRFGPSMMLPLQSGGRLIGTLALPRRRGARPYTGVEQVLAAQFASQAALALVLADAQHDRERLAVYEDRDRIARDLHDLVVQRLFATEMMLESTRRRAVESSGESSAEPSAKPSAKPLVEPSGEARLLERAVDELDSTIQEVRTAIFALQQPPADAPTSFRGRVLRETGGAAALLGFQPSVHFTGPVDALVHEPLDGQLLSALRGALAAAHRRAGVSAIDVEVDVTATLPDGRPALHLTVADDAPLPDGTHGTTLTWRSPL
ncbi:GAF domain-containing protein [Streptomyces sp. NPDC000410]|uniref:sensor histidine kinase n=1 Tax=Streptomyces sp. NPDC000410 TaxID=3154254 RepID=UPI0033179576